LVIQTADINSQERIEIFSGMVGKFPNGGVLLDIQKEVAPLVEGREGLIRPINSWLFTELNSCNSESLLPCLDCICKEILDNRKQITEIQLGVTREKNM